MHVRIFSIDRLRAPHNGIMFLILVVDVTILKCISIINLLDNCGTFSPLTGKGIVILFAGQHEQFDQIMSLFLMGEQSIN